MKGLADIANDEAFRAEARALATKDANAARRASLRRLKKRLARLYFVDTHPRREAFRRDINQVVDAWSEREAKRGAK